MNTSYVQGQTAQGGGELKLAILTAKGPSSYAAAGDVVYNPGSSDYIEFPMGCVSQSGNYAVNFIPTSAGYLRAGAPSPSQSGWTAIWQVSGKQGVIVVQNAAGIGMTPGTVVPIVFAGGTGGGAAGTVTVLTATTIAINLTNTGSYTSAPTATISGTGGTPATLTVTTAATAGSVAAATNLSAETIQFGSIVSQL
jgi:hypothetical protein